jgi:hypothetical protein
VLWQLTYLGYWRILCSSKKGKKLGMNEEILYMPGAGAAHIPGLLEDTVQFKKETKSELNEEIYAWCCGSSYPGYWRNLYSSKKKKNSGLNEKIYAWCCGLISGILEDTVQFKKGEKSGLNEDIYDWCCSSSHIQDTGGYRAVQKRGKIRVE